MKSTVLRGMAVVCACLLVSQTADALDGDSLTRAARTEETALRARLGMAVIDTRTGTAWNYRGDERFPLNSTHKTFACAALLAKVDGGTLSLDRAVSITPAMLVTYSPITKASLAPKTLSLAEICAASVSVSDNTAANVVLDAVGGPAGVTAYLRSIGDPITRLDRREPELNEATPGDPRDTTTPARIANSLRTVLLGDGLPAASRSRLTQWMIDDRVAGALLRASLPSGWRIADKTGAGGHGSRSIVAVLWPPDRPPLVVAIYVTETAASMQARDQSIARLGAAVIQAVDR